MHEQTLLILLTVPVLVLLSAVLCQRFVYRRGIHTKIRQISDTLKRISETGSDEKVMIFTDDPVLMELGGQINRVLTDRQKIKADFKRGEMSSRKMLSNISHDIKTPLTVVLGYLEMMRLDHDNEMLRKTEEKAEQVVSLVNQFFTLAKLEAGDTKIELGRINISEICRENVLDFYEILLQQAFQVELHIPETAVFVQGDRSALQRILHNLISNVMRYGSDGKYLGLFLRQDTKNVYIDVVDKGKGIGSDAIRHVFDRLYTMEDSRNRQIQGNGLGLTIAKNLAVQLGGDLSLTSIPDVRTTFTVRLKKISDQNGSESNL